MSNEVAIALISGGSAFLGSAVIHLISNFYTLKQLKAKIKAERATLYYQEKINAAKNGIHFFIKNLDRFEAEIRFHEALISPDRINTETELITELRAEIKKSVEHLDNLTIAYTDLEVFFDLEDEELIKLKNTRIELNLEFDSTFQRKWSNQAEYSRALVNLFKKSIANNKRFCIWYNEAIKTVRTSIKPAND